jgi:hypothetical protein
VLETLAGREERCFTTILQCFFSEFLKIHDAGLHMDKKKPPLSGVEKGG